MSKYREITDIMTLKMMGGANQPSNCRLTNTLSVCFKDSLKNKFNKQYFSCYLLNSFFNGSYFFANLIYRLIVSTP